MTRALWLPARLKQFGCKVELVRGWETRGTETSFRPKGLVVHHTAGAMGSNAPSLRICIDGRPDLPGPLCHILIGRDGTCYVIASGRANHAGPGGWRGLTGNNSVLGIEAENNGIGEPWTPVMRNAFHRASAACLAGIGADASMLAGHKEWAPDRKIDPARLDMDAFRTAVRNLLTGDDDMPSLEEIRKVVAEEIARQRTDDMAVWQLEGNEQAIVDAKRPVRAKPSIRQLLIEIRTGVDALVARK